MLFGDRVAFAWAANPDAARYRLQLATDESFANPVRDVADIAELALEIAGLPPGPLANPGRAALLAVVEPADSAYLYFVARGDGTHVFSRSYAEHERAVDEFQRRRRRR